MEWDNATPLGKAKREIVKRIRELAKAGSNGIGVQSAQGEAAPAEQTPVAPLFTGPHRVITTDLLPVPPLDTSLIPAPFRGWLTDIAGRGCFPLEYPTAAALVGLSSLVGRKLGIRPKRHDDWLVVPNLWGAVVGPPSMEKSPPVEEALRPLHRLVKEARDAHEAANTAFAAEKLVEKARADAAKDALKKAAKDKKTTA